jgi:hypothetical protein
MPWFRLDDAFDTHPKVLAAGNEAIGLFIRCGTYAARNLTDGHVPTSVVTLYGDTDLAARLVAVGLWHRVRTGWTIHDYLAYNPSRQDVEENRKKNAERQNRWRERQSNAVTNNVTNNAPTRPVPYVSTGSYQRAGPSYPQARKTRLESLNGGAATRQPPPVAEAIEKASYPHGRHAKDQP